MWYIIFAIATIVSIYGLWLLFVKAGEKGWKAAIPVYRELVFADLVGRKKWTVVFLLVPIVNIFVFYNLYFDFLKCFGKRSFLDTVAAVLIPFIVLPLWGNDSKVVYLGKSATDEFKEKYPYKKSVTREWADAIIFATIAASLTRTFVVAPYVIPTGSMERSLLVGDYLFVSILNYGPRIPITPLAFPFGHHTMPIIGGKAYSELIKLPYERLAGLSEINRYDVVVFNYPMDADPPYERPVDKRENYVKRLMGMPGDVIEMKLANFFVNGSPAYQNDDFQLMYVVKTKTPSGLDLNRLKEERFELAGFDPDQGLYLLHITEEEAQKVRGWTNVAEVKADIFQPGADASPIVGNVEAFPNYKDGTIWNYDNFGPFKIPSKGWTVELNSKTLPLYERAISVYEGNTLEKKGDQVIINGQVTNHYTFKMNYYWMMGDNRHNSLDSRGWGFVPEDHIIGKPLFTFFSWDKDGEFLSKVRWNRIFRAIH